MTDEIEMYGYWFIAAVFYGLSVLLGYAKGVRDVNVHKWWDGYELGREDGYRDGVKAVKINGVKCDVKKPEDQNGFE